MIAPWETFYFSKNLGFHMNYWCIILKTIFLKSLQNFGSEKVVLNGSFTFILWWKSMGMYLELTAMLFEYYLIGFVNFPPKSKWCFYCYVIKLTFGYYNKPVFTLQNCCQTCTKVVIAFSRNSHAKKSWSTPPAPPHTTPRAYWMYTIWMKVVCSLWFIV